MQYLVSCRFCDWIEGSLPSKNEAITSGVVHIAKTHPNADPSGAIPEGIRLLQYQSLAEALAEDAETEADIKEAVAEEKLIIEAADAEEKPAPPRPPARKPAPPPIHHRR